jgi:hypothetical protein
VLFKHLVQPPLVLEWKLDPDSLANVWQRGNKRLDLFAGAVQLEAKVGETARNGSQFRLVDVAANQNARAGLGQLQADAQ